MGRKEGGEGEGEERKEGGEERGKGGRGDGEERGRGGREEGEERGRGGKREGRKVCSFLFLGHAQLRVDEQKDHLFFACLDHRRHPTTLLSGILWTSYCSIKLWAS